MEMWRRKLVACGTDIDVSQIASSHVITPLITPLSHLDILNELI